MINLPDADGIVGANAIRAAADRACQALLARQRPDGAWAGELRTSIIHDADDLFLREYFGGRTAEQTELSARWIRSQQRPDSTWSNAHHGQPDLSITVAGYLALRLAGDDPQALHMARARDYIQAAGGLAATSVFTRTWLAMFGLWDWRDLPSLPPQIMLVPSRFPLTIYRFACWVRTTIVPMIVIGALRPTGDLGIELRDELFAGQPHRPPAPARTIRRVGRLLPRRRALRVAEKWIIDHQEEDGSWFSSRPPTIWALIALRALGHSLDEPLMRRALASLDILTIYQDTPSGRVRRSVMFNGCSWDTALSVVALRGCGLDPQTPELARATDYLIDQQTTAFGDWAVSRPMLSPGGWPFFDSNQGYPDVDDTSMVIRALNLQGYDQDTSDRIREAVTRGTTWAIGMQCREGGWAAFDADNTSDLADKLLTYTTATDRPCPEITGHMLEALSTNRAGREPCIRRGVDYLLRTQCADGSWPGRWMVHHIYGTSAALSGLVHVGIPTSHDAVQRGLAWLVNHQNADGGWGEDLHSLSEPDHIGRGESTPSQTAWAVLAFADTGHARHPCAQRGLAWLLGSQQPDGTWNEPHSVGVIGGGHIGYIPVRYDLSRIIWPTLTVARYLHATDRD